MIYNTMKHIKLFENFLNEETTIADIQDKIREGYQKARKLEQSLRAAQSKENPDRERIEIIRLKIQKQQLKNQSLQIDAKIFQLKRNKS